MSFPAHVYVDDHADTLSCGGCLESDSIPRRIRNDPERRWEFIELWALDHVDCDKFRDAAKAKANRELRKERDRRRLSGEAGEARPRAAS